MERDCCKFICGAPTTFQGYGIEWRMEHNKTCAKNLRKNAGLCYGGRTDISVQTLFEYSRIFDRQKPVDSYRNKKAVLQKHDLNFMNSGVNSLTIASLSNPCTRVLFSNN